jgi:hypothetical protein
MNSVNFSTWKLTIYKDTVLVKAVFLPKINQPIKMGVARVRIGGKPTSVVYGMRGSAVIKLHLANFGIFVSYAEGHIMRICALVRRMVVFRLSTSARYGCEFVGRVNEENSKYG